MNKKEAAIIKVLMDLKNKDELPPLDIEEEKLLQRALDPEEYFFHQVEKIFKKEQ